MKNRLIFAVSILALNFFIANNYFELKPTAEENNINLSTNKEAMKLGAFSTSLSVKDLAVSKQFYEDLGFSVLAGGMEMNYFIMKNENALIGIFQGMFEGNIMTFNPGWDESGKNTETFDDIRTIQKNLRSKNIKLETEVDESTTGPASFMVKDPDGNLILIDQHR